MSPISPESQVAQALASSDPYPLLLALAKELHDGGMAQTDLLDLNNSFALRESDSSDETRYDALLDTMDLIVGWCSPGRGLYPENGNRPFSA